MRRILVLGDIHIPRRASWIPREIVEFIESEKFDIVICTGDLTDEKVLNYLKSLGKEFYVVEGNMDHIPMPEREKVKVEDLIIGVIHGHQVYPRGNRKQLKDIAIEMNVDVLISGHTHSPDIYHDEVLLLNPGSATGVWGGGGGSLKPSFMVLEVKEKNVDVKLYELEKVLKCSLKETFKL